MSLVSTSQRNSLPEHMSAALLPWELASELHDLYKAYQEQFQPSGPAEIELIEQLTMISFKRRRIALAERASHMATAQQRSSIERGDQITRRALCADPSRDRSHTSSHEALKTDETTDIRDKRDLADSLQRSETAIALLEGAPEEDLTNEALALLSDDTRAWWEDHKEDLEDSSEPLSQHLLSFLRVDVIPLLKNGLKSIQQRPLVRQQIHGESLDPTRLTILHKMDERLARQFDQTLQTLERLQSKASKLRSRR